MTRSGRFWALLILVLTTTKGSESSELLIRLHGLPDLPDDTPAKTELLFLSVRLRDAVILETSRAMPAAEIPVSQPSEPSLFRVAFVGTPPAPIWIEGAGGSFPGNPVNIQLSGLQGSRASGLPMFPPASGKAIGYDPSGFKVTGPGSGPHHQRSFAAILVTGLVSGKCSEDSANPYEVVESLNPEIIKALEQEIRLQQSSAFDPATRVNPKIIQPTHVATGSMTFNSDGGVTATVMITDRNSGKVIAKSTASSPPGEPYWNAIDTAASKLSNDLCRGKQEAWSGTIAYRSLLDTKEERNWKNGRETEILFNELGIQLRLNPTGEVESNVTQKMLLMTEKHTEVPENCGTPMNPKPGVNITDEVVSLEGNGGGSPDADISISLEGDKLHINFEIAGFPGVTKHTKASKQINCGKIIRDEKPDPTQLEGLSNPEKYSFELDASADPDNQSGSKEFRLVEGGPDLTVTWSLKRNTEVKD